MFRNINNNVILLGDSVLNNAKYVEKQDTVYSKIKQQIDNVHLFAEDGATLMDAYQQLDKIYKELYIIIINVNRRNN